MMKKIKDMGEEQLTRLATQLLSNEKFVLAMQSVIARTLKTREQLEGAVQTVLAGLSVPSRNDLDDLTDRLGDLEALVDELARKVDAVEAPAKKPASKAGKGGRKSAAQG
jgi:BMFP domain-containing protein YqiC